MDPLEFIRDPHVINDANTNIYSGKVVNLWLKRKLIEIIKTASSKIEIKSYYNKNKRLNRFLLNSDMYVHDIEVSEENEDYLRFERSEIKISVSRKYNWTYLYFPNPHWSAICLGQTVGSLLKAFDDECAADFLNIILTTVEEYLLNRNEYQNAVIEYRNNQIRHGNIT
nr:hypothetical protein [uncultured bacterium]